MNESATWQRTGLPMNEYGDGPDHARTLHVRCGSDIHASLTTAGFTGRFLEFSDPYCQGPVRRLPRNAFIDERAAFIADAYEIDGDSSVDDLHVQYDGLERAGVFDRLVLWFEHDTYDQLILAAVLSTLSAVTRTTPVELICVDDVPGVERFIGLGQLSPSQLLTLWRENRRAVTEADVDQAVATWDAVRSDDPAPLAALAAETHGPMPIMTRALRRHLRELPGVGDGLGLTQRLVLEILASSGPLTAGEVFRELMMKREPLPYLGDLMFWHVVSDLMATSEPVLTIEPDSRDQSWPRKKLSITETSRCILEGTIDYLDLYEGTRWIGGVAASRSRRPPRWDHEENRLIPG